MFDFTPEFISWLDAVVSIRQEIVYNKAVSDLLSSPIHGSSMDNYDSIGITFREGCELKDKHKELISKSNIEFKEELEKFKRLKIILDIPLSAFEEMEIE